MEKITGTVVKLTEKQIVLLMPDGSFKNIRRSRNQVPLIGERIAVESARAPVMRYARFAAAAAACFVIALILKLGFLFPESMNPVFTVALDINPSIEIQVDKQYRVMGVKAVNKDAEKVLDGTAYSKMDLFKAVDDMIGRCISDGYLKRDREGYIEITVIPAPGKVFSFEKKMRTSVQELLRNRNIKAGVEVNTASGETLDMAHASGLSVNRYILYKGLLEKGAAITAKEAEQLPLSELKNYEALHKNEMENTTPSGKGRQDAGENTVNTGEVGSGGTPESTGAVNNNAGAPAGGATGGKASGQRTAGSTETNKAGEGNSEKGSSGLDSSVSSPGANADTTANDNGQQKGSGTVGGNSSYTADAPEEISPGAPSGGQKTGADGQGGVSGNSNTGKPDSSNNIESGNNVDSSNNAESSNKTVNGNYTSGTGQQNGTGKEEPSKGIGS